MVVTYAPKGHVPHLLMREGATYAPKGHVPHLLMREGAKGPKVDCRACIKKK
jgi:hypothetical protein